MHVIQNSKGTKGIHENEVIIYIPIPVTQYLYPGTTIVTILRFLAESSAYEYLLFLITRTRVNYTLFCTLTFLHLLYFRIYYVHSYRANSF